MQTQRADDFDTLLEQKTSQLELSGQSPDGLTGYLFFCNLCDEILVLSKKQINPRRVQFAFNGNCPSCGFELDKVLDCKTSNLPSSNKRLFTNPKCKDPGLLFESEENFPTTRTQRGSILAHDEMPHLTSGIDSIDKILVLKRGQLVSFLGKQAHDFSLLFLTRAMLPNPQGLNSDIVFVDGGNIFTTYTVSQHANSYGVDSEKIQERVHLSRAFTHHQLYNLMVEKLPIAIDTYNAKFAIVSDVTLLYSDPDVRDKIEACDLFRKSLHHLSMTAEQKHCIIIVTNLLKRNRIMEDELLHIPHVSIQLVDHGAYTQLVVARHPFLPEKNEEVVTLDNQTLTGYFS